MSTVEYVQSKNYNTQGTDGTMNKAALKGINAGKPHHPGYSRWADNILNTLNENYSNLDKKIPPNRLQVLLDGFYEDHLKPILHHPKAKALNDWLNDNGHGDWYKKLGIYILKLPLRSVRDILQMFYHVVKGIVFGLVHPLKGLNKAGQFLVRLVEAMKQPEFYTSVGAGAIGAACGQCLFTGLYLPGAISLGVGTLFLAFGLTYDAVRIASNAKQGKRLQALKEDFIWQNLDRVAQSFTTGLLLGLAFGFANRVVTRTPTPTEASNYFQQYMKSNHYNTSDVFWKGYYPDGSRIIWSWTNPPANPPTTTWLSLDPAAPWSNKIWTYSSIKVPGIAQYAPAGEVFAKTVAAQAMTAAVNTPLPQYIPEGSLRAPSVLISKGVEATAR